MSRLWGQPPREASSPWGLSPSQASSLHPVPKAEPGEATPDAPETGANAGRNLQYRRRTDGWESFRCACDKVHQLSPGLKVKTLTCQGCERRIEILDH